MEQNSDQNKYFISPGCICVPKQPSKLAVVVASGVAVALYDKKNKFGGIAHYIQPVRKEGLSTAMFAAPALVCLLKMLVVRGADKRNLQASIFGGAVNSEATNYTVGTSEQNVAVGLEILEKMSVEVICNNTGGSRARKIVFDSATGETVMAVVDSVRDTDWYPSVPEVNKIT